MLPFRSPRVEPERPTTVGAVTFDGKAWVIACEPHVRVRLKRVFARVSKSQHDAVTLSDTLDNARELLWFMQRYPMLLDEKAGAYLNERAAAHVAREAMIARVVAPDYAPQAFTLAVPARTYQEVAAELLLKSGALLLADDVGVGKTCSAICALTDPRTRPALVVTLTHLPHQWQAELQKFAPHLRVHIITKGQTYELPPWDVLIVNYHKLAGWADVLAPQVRCVIFDEMQELRIRGSQKWHAARHVAEHADFACGLTATPVYNYGGEIFTVLDTLRPDCLGTMAEFGREWCGHELIGTKSSIDNPRALGRYLRSQGLMLRRTRAEVGRELPALTRIPHAIDCDLDALHAVEVSARELAEVIMAEDEEYRGEKLQAAQEFSMLLRQATGIAKAPYVAAFVRMLLEAGEPVVLFGWHRQVYETWRAKLREFSPAFYTGSESPKQKQEAKRRFCEGETDLFIISLRAGAGVDGLQHRCRTVVVGELDWSPGVHEQCIGRVYRDGQPDPVAAYFLIAEAGSDPVVADVLGLKRQQSEGIRDPDAEILEQLAVDPQHVKRLAAAYLAKKGRVT